MKLTDVGLDPVLLAFNMRSEHRSVFGAGFFANRLIVIWGMSTFAFILLATLLPPLRVALKITPLSPDPVVAHRSAELGRHLLDGAAQARWKA